MEKISAKHATKLDSIMKVNKRKKKKNYLTGFCFRTTDDDSQT